MDFKQLESFITISKLNSFSKAAEKLFLTQPTISNHIQSLEKELGTILFNRTNKKITLTESGEILYEYAISILNKRDLAFFSLNEFKGKIEGILEISSSTIPEEYYLTDVISKFNIIYPEVKYLLMKYDTKQVLDKIQMGEIDFGIVGAKKEIPNIKYIKIFDDEIVLIAPKNEKYNNIESMNIKDLKNFPIIMRENGSGTRENLCKKLNDSDLQFNDLNVIAEIESNQTIKKFVMKGLGISFISNRAIQDELSAKKIKVIKVNNFSIKRSFYFAYHDKRALSPLAKTFKDFIINS
jgi:DNA-binding transcriptional LysR family regulator